MRWSDLFPVVATIQGVQGLLMLFAADAYGSTPLQSFTALRAPLDDRHVVALILLTSALITAVPIFVRRFWWLLLFQQFVLLLSVYWPIRAILTGMYAVGSPEGVRWTFIASDQIDIPVIAGWHTWAIYKARDISFRRIWRRLWAS